MEEVKEINPDKANELIQTGALLIDVREPDEVREVAFDVEDMQNMPLSIFGEYYQGIPKDRKIILACHLGVRSFNVAQFLLMKGWNAENIFSLAGGINAWQYEDLPVSFDSEY